jgi:hypothetical protein
MRLKSAALFAVGFLSVSFWLHGSARCQSSLGPPLSLAPPPWGTDQGSPAAATSNLASPGVSSPRTTAKGSPPPATKNVWPPTATDDVPPPTATAKRSTPSAAAKNSPPTANSKDAQPPAMENISPTPVTNKLSPSSKPAADYDGFIVGIDDVEGTGRPLPNRPRPAKQSNVRQKPDATGGSTAIQPLDDQAEVEKLKPKLTICRGC